jgi:hypothetical protein
MSILHIRNGRRFNIYAGGVIDGVRYANFVSPEIQESLGITPVNEPLPPEDYSQEHYTRNEIDEPPYVEYNKKPDDVLKYERREHLEAYIAQTEASTLLARPTREFMLTLFELEAIKAGLTPEQLALVNPGYAKVKALDVEITAARDEIRTITAEIGEQPAI